MQKTGLRHFIFFLLCVYLLARMDHFAYLFTGMKESYYVFIYFLIMIICSGFIVYKNFSVVIKIVLFILLYLATGMFLKQFSELEAKKLLDIRITSTDSYCEEYLQCYIGATVTRGNETFTINKESCLKYDWEWSEEGKYCTIFKPFLY